MNTLATFRKPSPISLSSARHITWIERCPVRRATVEPSTTWSSATTTLQKKGPKCCASNSLASSTASVMASSGRQRGSAQASPALSTLPRQPEGDLTGRNATNKLQPKNFAHLADGRPLCGHPVLTSTAKGTDLSRPAEAPITWAKSSPNGGRNYLRTVGDIIPQ